MIFTLKPFYELFLDELYECLRLRQEVFVVEQDCPYLDNDDKDQKGLHLMGKVDGELMAYARLLPKGVSYENYASIGRIVTSLKGRGKGYGKSLVQTAIAEIEQNWGKQAIKISAQQYLLKFYQELGFQAVGEDYLEDDIPHIAMIRP
ncbi:MAG: GNAT family N-acetyltransferase [Bacteroidota bacterium]